MSLDKLINDGSLHPFQATRDEIDKAMEIAIRDLNYSKHVLSENLDWAYSIAYNAVLQACRAFIFHQGYRPASAEAHKITLAFMQFEVDPQLKESVSYFDRVRKKRHRVIYDEIGLVSEKEAQQLIEKSTEFITWVEEKLKK
jgi:uncharacterized protein (UPF0332 family)